MVKKILKKICKMNVYFTFARYLVLVRRAVVGRARAIDAIYCSGRATGATLPLPVCMHDEEWQR